MEEKLSSQVSGFYKLKVGERLEFVRKFCNLSQEEMSTLENTGTLPIEVADHLIENTISTIEIPLGVATNFRINDKDYLIPMAIEEPSVVAACSNSAKVARETGGFYCESTNPIMIGQIQLEGYESSEATKKKILENKAEIIKAANTRSKTLAELNAGAKDLEVRVFDSPYRMIVVHILVDVQDAMGANVVNSMCEYIAPMIEKLTGAKVNLRILSNLSVHRLSRARAKFRKEDLGGEEVVDSIISAYKFAAQDPFRAATHNKGIMNGIDAVVLATLNDWRAIEAGAHAYAALSSYTSLTKYEKDENGDILASIEIPLAVGTVGGATANVPKARIAKKILGIKDSREFANVLAAVGLSQNFSAVRALATEGIQRGHMELHARQLALSAGAKGTLIDEVSQMMIDEKNITMTRAKEILEKLSANK
ncbi:3-hydroxy-3-methylglutaryl-CoA reductase [uncultured archaeon]|nr:3-hydroxy-3-methylglutaryl-CoA reductase [uncultured archaeon]HKJ96969.1 hydroxymethylglutaryl-CoA reductase, degradative [Thermoplasmataceae archaeon]